MPYDTLRDLTAVTKVAESPMVMMVPAASKFNNARDLIDYARKNPGKLTYGSGGVGSTPHLTTELLGSVTGAKFLHVPYKGGGESIRALISGEVDLLIDSITSSGGSITSGRVKALAVAQPNRSPRLPNVPTFEEAGIKNFSMTHWVGIIAPSHVPAEVSKALYGHVVKALQAPDVVQRFQELGAAPVGDTPADFQKFVSEEVKKWQQTVKAANIQPQ
jgi:tripartite-type tricarboxylate transporter receptor subunit TctC